MGVSYLLDTHAFVWLLEAGRVVPRRIATTLTAPGSRLLVSAASAMEVATKTRLGKLPGGEALVTGWRDHVDRLQAEHLPIDADHALAAGSFDWAHRDPFDRMLAAQAIVNGLRLVSADAVFGTLPGLTLLRWR